MVEIIRADLSNRNHAEALVSLMSEYAQDPMGGGKDLAVSVKENLAATLNKRNDAHVVLAYVDELEKNRCQSTIPANIRNNCALVPIAKRTIQI